MFTWVSTHIKLSLAWASLTAQVKRTFAPSSMFGLSAEWGKWRHEQEGAVLARAPFLDFNFLSHFVFELQLVIALCLLTSTSLLHCVSVDAFCGLLGKWQRVIFNFWVYFDYDFELYFWIFCVYIMISVFAGHHHWHYDGDGWCARTPHNHPAPPSQDNKHRNWQSFSNRFDSLIL